MAFSASSALPIDFADINLIFVILKTSPAPEVNAGLKKNSQHGGH